MKQCDICLEEFNPHEETTCKTCNTEIGRSHVERYHEQKERIKALESAMQGFYKEIQDALYKTPEFNNYECGHGHSLGDCLNEDCIHCRLHRLVDEFKQLLEENGKSKN